MLSAEGTGGHFINNAGADVLTAGTGNRWLVYIDSMTGNTFGNLDSANTAVWNATYGTYAPGSVTQTGDRYLFNYQPTATLTGNTQHKTYGDTVDLTNAYSVSGLEPGVANAYLADTAATAYSGVPSLTSAGAAVTATVSGSPYDIVLSNAPTGINGYAVVLANGSLIIDKRNLTLTATGSRSTTGLRSFPARSWPLRIPSVVMMSA